MRKSIARALVATLVATFGLAGAASAATTVSLSFDDGTLNQYRVAVPILNAAGTPATFFINSGRTANASPNGFYMGWAQVHDVYASPVGHEIGGHTVDHAKPDTLTADQKRHEVCDDRRAILAQGFPVTDFAYTYGVDAIGKAVVQGCGYNSARRVGGLRSYNTCSLCPFAETIPPRDVFDTRTVSGVNSTVTLEQLQTFVTNAEANGGGWVQIVFHQICVPEDPDSCFNESVNRDVFQQFIQWLAPRAANGTVVRTIQQVVGGPVQPVPEDNGAAAAAPGTLPPPKPGSGLSGTGGDILAPVIVNFRATPKRFLLGRKRTAVTALKRGTSLRYLVSEPGIARIEIQKRVARAGARQWRTVGTLQRTTTKVSNRVAFSGRIGRKRLSPGSYRARLTVTDPAGNRSNTRSASFRIVRG